MTLKIISTILVLVIVTFWPVISQESDSVLSEMESRKCADDQNLVDRPPIPPGFVLEIVLKNRGWLYDGYCPDRVVLLRFDSQYGLERYELLKVRDALEKDGCTVVEKTKESFTKYINPDKDQWRENRLKGAVSAGVSVCYTVSGDLAIEIGWYKGTLSAKSRTFFFKWNGEQWIERDDLIIVTVS